LRSLTQAGAHPGGHVGCDGLGWKQYGGADCDASLAQQIAPNAQHTSLQHAYPGTHCTAPEQGGGRQEPSQ
jgi:hypothetical protein